MSLMWVSSTQKVSHSTNRSWQPVTVASARRRHSKSVLWLTPRSSAARSTGALRHIGLMKEAWTGSSFRQCPRTVPVREVNLLPECRQHHLGTPAAVEPSLQAPPALWLESIGLRGLGHRAHADLIAAAPLVDGLSKQQELVGGEARCERPEGVSPSHLDLPHPSERPP